MCDDAACQRGLAFGGRLQERAGREFDAGAAHADDRRRALRHALAVPRQAREPMALAHCGECRGDMRLQWSRPAYVDVEARLARRHRNLERLLERLELLRDGPRGSQGSVKPWRQDRAAIDRHDVVLMGGRETDGEHAVRAAARVKYRAPATLTMGINRIVNRGIESSLLQGRAHERALPGAVLIPIPVLQGATATHAEMRTDRRDAFGARAFDAQQLTAIRMTGPSFNLNGLARQCVGHVDRSRLAADHTVAAMAEVRDDQAFNHGCAGANDAPLCVGRYSGCARRAKRMTRRAA
jgi:hypothetical protein